MFFNVEGEETVADSKQTKTRKKQEPKRKLISPKKLCVFNYFVEENCVVYNEGMNDVNEKLSHMTVYVRTISGKTISIRCDWRQSITRIKDEIERKTKIPKANQHLSNQGKH